MNIFQSLKMIFPAVLFMLIISNCGKPEQPAKEIPESLYVLSSHPKDSPLGKWRYANHQFFEFSGTQEKGKWEFYFDYGQGKQIQFAGSWQVFQYDPQKSSGLLKLTYEQIGLGNPQILDPKTKVPLHRLYPLKRWQIVEFYADDHLFGMNVYFKKDGADGFIGTWTHVNYDWFDDFYFWSESPLWMEKKKFEEQILKKIASPADREFVEKQCYVLNLETYYRQKDISDEALSRLNSLMEEVRSKNGYRGEWFFTPLSSIPKLAPYYVNRKGDLTFSSDGKVDYRHESVFFTSSQGDLTRDLPMMDLPKNDAQAEVSASFEIWETPSYNEKGLVSGQEASLKLYDSSNPYVIGDWEFKALVLKDRRILITFPFRRVR